jgi:hypothetical protein
MIQLLWTGPGPGGMCDEKIVILAGVRLKVKLSYNTNKANLYYYVFKSSETSC